MRARDGTIIEVSEWKSREAIDAAHKNPNILAMWEEFFDVCDCVPLNTLAEASECLPASRRPIRSDCWRNLILTSLPQGRQRNRSSAFQWEVLGFFLPFSLSLGETHGGSGSEGPFFRGTISARQ